MSTHQEFNYKSLAIKAHSLPKVPGVYLLKDDRGVVLYVGKAAHLPTRVGSYFRSTTDLGPRKQRLLELIRDFDVIPCESEWEALLMENRLIKDLHPKFNRSLTDDKSYPYLVITLGEEFPGVYITREPTNDRYKGARVLGPFTSVTALRDAVKLLQRVFRFRTCDLEIRAQDTKRRFFRPCLLHAIRQCTGPCGDRISQTDYRTDVDRFVRFLDSKRSEMLRQLQREMEEASQALAYERAAALRDQIEAIEKLDERGKKSQRWQPEIEAPIIDPRRCLASLQKVLSPEHDLRCLEGVDIAHLQGQQTVGAKVCFVDGRPLKNEYRRYRVQTATNDDCAAIREVVSRAYADAAEGRGLFPDLLVVDGGPTQLAAALEAFGPSGPRPPMVIAIAKKEEVIWRPNSPQPIRLGREHPGLRLVQAVRDESHRFAQQYHHLLRSKEMLE